MVGQLTDDTFTDDIWALCVYCVHVQKETRTIMVVMNKKNAHKNDRAQ